MSHPLITWFRENSGWTSAGVTKPEHAASEGKAMIDSWNAAIDAAADQVVPDGNPMLAKDRICGLRYEPE